MDRQRKTCACNCGQPVNPGRTYVHGHNSRKWGYEIQDGPLATPCKVYAVTPNRPYATVTVDGKQKTIARYVYEKAHGPVPKPFEIYTECGNGHCGELSHTRVGRKGPRPLRIGTRAHAE